MHAYIHPQSCSAPHLNESGVSIAKTVGVRLRTIHSNDNELLQSLNKYAGYLIARGYDEQSIKYHLTQMANRDRVALLNGDYKPKPKLLIPMVVDLHPAITALTTMVSSNFRPTLEADPILKSLIPPSSLTVAYRKLPTLQRILCTPDQNSPHCLGDEETGHVDIGCKCQVCKVSKFGRFATSPSLPGYKIPIKTRVSCKSSPAVVYHLTCNSGRPECQRAHYVGMASTSNPKKKAISLRWSNYKSHHKNGLHSCGMSTHLAICHKGENIENLISLTLLEECPSADLAKEAETAWMFKLFSFHPTGLNIREEENLSD